jgi:prepilin-type N-terminal cleavage/methylation domain-containing protein
MATPISSVAAAVPAAPQQQMRPARPPLQGRTLNRAFTLIELVIVMAIILVLAGLILATSNYVQKKGYRSRAEAEIAAISAALENYKADNGVYPRDPTPNTATDKLNAKTDINASPNPTPSNPSGATYRPSSLVLYRALCGDRNLDRNLDASDLTYDIDGSTLASPLTQLPKSYFPFKPSMLSPTDGAGSVQFIRDPFGNSYGYSTAHQSNSSNGYNPTFDLWSTSGDKDPNETDQQYVARWIKNW